MQDPLPYHVLMQLRSLVSAACLLAVASAQHDHGHREDETTAPELWETSSIYELGKQSYSLEFCTSSEELLEDAACGMIVALVPVTAATDDASIAAATNQAAALRNTFASTKVLRQSLYNGMQMQLGNSSLEVLYRVEFSEEDEDEAAHSGEEEEHEHEHEHVEGETHCVVVGLRVPTASKYMLFAEHGADEVAVRVLLPSSSSAENAVAVDAVQCVTGCEEDAVSDSKRVQGWGAPILASLITSLTALLGVFILSFDKGRIEVIVEYMTSFAAGCLLGVVAFHLYPEGSEYVADLGEWVMGACVLGGIALSMLLEQGVHLMLSSFGAEPCTSHAHGHHDGHPLMRRVASMHEKAAVDSTACHSHASHHVDIEGGSTQPFSVHEPHTPSSHTVASNEARADDQLTFRQQYISSLRRVQPVAWITAIGDFFHAFTDGVVLAVAFKSCSSSLGWAVMFGILLHEVPHRVGDFFIFLKAGMVIAQALVVNLVASLASFLGVVILLAAGEVSDHALGFMLAFGTGALLFIAMSELLPPMLEVRERRGAFIHFVCFSLGCVLIGLSKLQDVHCDAATGQEISH